MIGAGVARAEDLVRGAMALVPAGAYAPILRAKDEPERVPVPAFLLDVRPVTNAEYLAFVRAHPAWGRSAVSPLFADSGYLADWAGDLELGPQAPAEAPVVRVSWFAARAFARSQSFQQLFELNQVVCFPNNPFFVALVGTQRVKLVQRLIERI